MNIQAKFVVVSATLQEWGEEVAMRAVYSDSPENKTFSDATPCASVSMTISNKAAQGFFKEGQEYVATFEALENPPIAEIEIERGTLG